MKKEFSIYTNDLKVVIKGDKITGHRAFGDLTVWNKGVLVASIPKHSLKKFTVLYKHPVLIQAYQIKL